MDVPASLKYTEEHEWVSVEDDIATVGITDYAQGELGDIVFIELPRIDEEVKQNESFGTIEAVKAVSDLFAPVSGIVVEVNEMLTETPEIVNKDPYVEGWMIKVRMSDASELDSLMDAKAYKDKLS
jgi:glycine cleavage system H protein